MKFQILFSGEKAISKCLLLNLPSMLSVNLNVEIVVK